MALTETQRRAALEATQKALLNRMQQIRFAFGTLLDTAPSYATLKAQVTALESAYKSELKKTAKSLSEAEKKTSDLYWKAGMLLGRVKAAVAKQRHSKPPGGNTGKTDGSVPNKSNAKYLIGAAGVAVIFFLVYLNGKE
jgi:hypothetical protein